VATVFGATGFLGRYIVNELGKVGSQVVIPYRGEQNATRHLKILGDLGQIVPLQCDVFDPDSIEEVISRSNVVVNLIGKRWSTVNFSLDTVNHVIPANIAKVAEKVGVEKFVHVSALGAAPDSPSEWFRSKYAGEVAVREACPDTVIVRPAGIFGFEDRLLNKWARLSRVWPVLPILKGYENRKEGYLSQPDFSRAMYRIIVNDNNGSTFDLAGPEVTMHELLTNIVDTTLVKKRIFPVSLDTALNYTKYAQYIRRSRFTSDEILGLTTDVTVNPENRTIEELDITPSSILNLSSRYIKHYRIPISMLNINYETK